VEVPDARATAVPLDNVVTGLSSMRALLHNGFDARTLSAQELPRVLQHVATAYGGLLDATEKYHSTLTHSTNVLAITESKLDESTARVSKLEPLVSQQAREITELRAKLHASEGVAEQAERARKALGALDAKAATAAPAATAATAATAAPPPPGALAAADVGAAAEEQLRAVKGQLRVVEEALQESRSAVATLTAQCAEFGQRHYAQERLLEANQAEISALKEKVREQLFDQL